MPLRIVLTLAVFLVNVPARGQTTATALDTATSNPTTAVAIDTDEKHWAFSLSAYTYIVEDSRDYVQPTFTADRDWLHLEARYNYEDLDTTSVWIGYNWSTGEELTLDFTAMLGGIAGRTEGVAPGYKLTLAWRGLELYSELEYVIDTEDSSDSFLYTWSELTYTMTDWLRAGVVIQRTKAYDSDFDIQRGLMVGITYKQADFTAHVLNPDDDPVFVIGVAFDF
jgi:hypothetical protein